MLKAALIALVGGLSAAWAAVSLTRHHCKLDKIKIGVLLIGSVSAYASILVVAERIFNEGDVSSFTQTILYLLILDKVLKRIDQSGKRNSIE